METRLFGVKATSSMVFLSEMDFLVTIGLESPAPNQQRLSALLPLPSRWSQLSSSATRQFRMSFKPRLLNTLRICLVQASCRDSCPLVLKYLVLKPLLLKPLLLKPLVAKAPGAKSPCLLKPLLLKPLVLKPLVLKPLELKALVLKPLELKPLVLSPSGAKALLLSASVLKPALVKAPVLKPLVLKPLLLKPLLLSPVAKALFAKAPWPLVLKPLVPKPLVLKPLVLKPLVLKPLFVKAPGAEAPGAKALVLKPLELKPRVLKPLSTLSGTCIFCVSWVKQLLMLRLLFRMSPARAVSIGIGRTVPQFYNLPAFCAIFTIWICELRTSNESSGKGTETGCTRICCSCTNRSSAPAGPHSPRRYRSRSFCPAKRSTQRRSDA
uniref:PPE family protein PPE24 n=1 Tax=Macrostomum lignano TaxID=282301 RepID=A0A1I8F9X7_9PLAT